MIAGVETFVVRLIRPAPGAGGLTLGGLHGVVEHLRSKQSLPFRGSDELLRLLTDGLATRTRAEAGQADSRNSEGR